MASFDTDYLVLKSAKYTAFGGDQPYEEVRAKAGYTQEDPSKSSIQSITYDSVKNINKLANSSFENFSLCKQDQSYFGWNTNELSEGASVKITNESNTPNGHSFLLEAGKENTNLSQWVECAYGGYTFDYSLLSEILPSSEINLEFHYWNSYRNKEVKDATSLSLTSTNWEEKKGTLTLPDNCYHLEMRISAKKGSVYLDDSSLIYKGKN